MKITYSGQITPIKFAVTIDGKDQIHGKIVRTCNGYYLDINGIQWSHSGEPRNGGQSVYSAKTVKKLRQHLINSIPQITVIQEAKRISVEEAQAKQIQLNREFLLALTSNEVKFGLPNDDYLGYEFVGGISHHASLGNVSVHLPKFRLGMQVKFVGTDTYIKARFKKAKIVDTDPLTIRNVSGQETIVNTQMLEKL